MPGTQGHRSGAPAHAHAGQALALGRIADGPGRLPLLGVCNGGSPSHFLKQLGPALSDTGCVEIDDSRRFVAMPHDAPNEPLLPQELIARIKRRALLTGAKRPGLAP